MLAAGIQRLEVHGLPDGAGLDVCGIQGADEFVARATDLPLFDQEATQPICMQAVRRLRHERDAGKVREGVAIAERDGPSLLDTKVQACELPPSDPCQP